MGGGADCRIPGRMIAYFGLFASALLAATILPMQSEAVLVGLLVAGEGSVAVLLIVATAGNVLGAVINWLLGRFVLRFKERRWFPVSEEQLARAETWYRRYGRWSLLGSWLPIIGDPITVAAGVMREPIMSFLVLVTLAKAARYMVLAAATLAWFS
ncbi:MAG: YqaA family protein [Rhizobiaceae bacterium]